MIIPDNELEKLRDKTFSCKSPHGRIWRLPRFVLWVNPEPGTFFMPFAPVFTFYVIAYGRRWGRAVSVGKYFPRLVAITIPRYMGVRLTGC